MWGLSRLRAIVAIAFAQLRHDRTQTILAILGITLAVLASTLLASVGVGVVQTGQEKFDASGRDLWVTGGPVRLNPSSVGGFENTVVDSHRVADEIQAREDVKQASPLSFQTVYVSTNTSEFETIVGTGIPQHGRGAVSIEQGTGFVQGDVHYAGGNYSGPMTHELVIDPRVADRFDVGVGDTLYVGGTLSSARQNEFTIVGVSSTFSQFLGAPTVIMHLSELQEITGTTGSDRATLITIDLHATANPTAVKAELEQQYPGYEIRTNREQLQATLQQQAVVIASGTSLVLLAVLAGLALTVNMSLSIVYHQRRELAALKAAGSKTSTLVGITVVQSLFYGTIAGVLGAGLTYPLVKALNYIALSVVGFENLVQVSIPILGGGAMIGIGMSLAGALTASWRLARLSPLKQLAD
ncbi:putative ABC transport system permease protein [Halogranum rubrum]|uniref:Putative ABC transport system permease protein n=1 Tax=Halogranum rubrum TaxID=553466 RepID=A0A1I4BA90_9EURY|nr:ABC transporter permease [Halogranum rubrum]SFK64856.1 putative ABC transport system permease protein [Halogranum rubrum]